MDRSTRVCPLVWLLAVLVSPVGTRIASAQPEPPVLLIVGIAEVKGRDVFGTQFALGSGPFTLELTVSDPGKPAPDSAGQQTWTSAFFDFNLHGPSSGFPRGGSTNQNTLTAAREGEPNADFLSFFIGDCTTTMCSFPVDSIGNTTEALGFEGSFGNALLLDGALGAGPFSTLGDFAQAAAGLDLSTATSTLFNASWVPECLLEGRPCSASNGPGDIRFVSVNGTISDINLADEMGLIGDYNEDGIVGAADYTLWRDKQGQTFTLPNENPDAATPGVVDQEDYDFWVANFGATLGAGADEIAVPEPSTLVVMLISLGAIFMTHCKSCFGRQD